MVGHRLPAALHQAAMTEHLEILRLRFGARLCIGQARRKRGALERHLLHAVDHLRRLDAYDIEQGRHEIAGMAELVAQLASRGDTLVPGHHQRIADTAAVRVLLVAAQRCVGRHRPAPGEVGMRVGAADIVDAGNLLVQRLAPEIVGAHRIDHAERAAFLAGTVVRHDDHQRVFELACGLKELHQPADMLVGMFQHGSIGGLQAREHAPFGFRNLGPRTHRIVARRQLRRLGDDTHLDLSRETLLTLDIPAFGKNRVVLRDHVERRLVRRMTGAEGDPGEPRRFRIVADMVGEVADRLVHEIGCQVVARGEGARRIDRRVVAHQLRRVLIRLGIHETIEAIETAPQRPAVERTGRARFRERRHVPLAQHVVAIAVRAQHFGDGAGLAADLAAIAGIARIEVGEAADADGVMVASGQQRRPRGRAHRRRVEAGVAQAALGDGVDGRRGDRRAIAAEVGEADIVEQDHQDIGGTTASNAKWPLGCFRPIGLGVLNSLADLAVSFARHALPFVSSVVRYLHPAINLVAIHGPG